MTILIAPDKFKGSLSAQEVCDAIADALTSAGKFDVVELPLADGGEGTCELLTSFSAGTMNSVRVRDPLSRVINSGLGISKDGKTAFLEMATASGLQLLKKEERNPLFTTTAGTGDLIRYALDHKVEHIIMGVGGSGTNDGGMGMAESLGVVFYDAAGLKLQGNGQNMRRVHSFDATSIHPELAKVKFTIFCDVDNPLHGLHGAAYIFSPQKGADEKVVEELDQGLKHYQHVLEKTLGRSVDFPGAGAGGGLPASLKAFANITIRRGMEFIAEFTKLEEKVMKADFIITGEGKVDQQTLSGKVVKGIADLSKKHKKSLIVIAGKNELSPHEIQLLGAAKIVTLVRENIEEQQAISQAESLIKSRVKEEIIPLFL